MTTTSSDDISIRTAKRTLQPGFAADTESAVAEVRKALAAFLAGLSQPIRRPKELQKALGVDYNICWHVFNVLTDNDPLVAARHTPTPSALRRFLKSGQEAGIDEARIQAVESAIAHFNEVVRKHADDRKSFQSMVSSLSSEGGDDAVRFRRQVHRGMCQLWGAQCESQFNIAMFRKSLYGPGKDFVSFGIKTGFRRLRASANPIVAGVRDNAQTTSSGSPVQIPLDPEAAELYESPLVRAFSSNPVPALKTEVGGKGWLYTRLATKGIGRTSAIDLAFGTEWRNSPMLVDPISNLPFIHTAMTVRTPSELLIFDLLVHRPSYGRVKPEVSAAQSMPMDELPSVSRVAPQLELSETVLDLGPADKVIGTPDWPTYGGVLRYIAPRFNCDLSEYDVYRFRLEYPVVGSIIRLHFDLK